jgi:hypothetical protein
MMFKVSSSIMAEHELLRNIIYSERDYFEAFFKDKDYGTSLKELGLFFIYMPEFLKSFKEGLKYRRNEQWLIWTYRFPYSFEVEKNTEEHYRILLSDALKNFSRDLGEKKLQDFDKQNFVEDILYLAKSVLINKLPKS